ncbi:UNVERIFIED_CONTAM: hypothetical protein GTU68_026626 [Idotea baltica]|nr:hypothetical protein [Idotea baltica]
MIFNSSIFIVFASLFFLINWKLSSKMKLLFILLASYLFYGWWNWKFCFLLATSTVCDYFIGLHLSKSADTTRRKWLLASSVLINLGILMQTIGWQIDALHINILLPVGISFYTFQTLSYTIDVYRKEINAEPNFIKFAVFVAYFPQLVAGPIERAKNLLPQLNANFSCSYSQFKEGLWLIIWGFFLKMVVADNMARIVDPTFASLDASGTEIILATLAFSLQIYGDFAGYSKIARGISKWIGIELIQNFRQPYFAISPSDFWQRWHISLSQWLRDYLYISLGGNRKGKWISLRNLLLTMLLGGLWHGASWVFLIWGAYHGVLLILYRVITRGKTLIVSQIALPKKIILQFAMLLFTIYGWLIFRSENWEQLCIFTKNLSVDLNLLSQTELKTQILWLILFSGCVKLVDFFTEYTNDEFVLAFKKAWHYPIAILLVFLIFTFGASSNQFIYFQF